MKILKIILAALLLALTFINTTIVSAETNAYTNYTPTVQDAILAQKYNNQIVDISAKLESKFGVSGTIARLNTVIQKSTALRTKTTSGKLYFLLLNIEDSIGKEIAKRTTVQTSKPVVSTSTAPVASSTPVVSSSSITSDGITPGVIDAKKVKEIIATLAYKNPSTFDIAVNAFMKMGFSQKEARTLSILREEDHSATGVKARKDIFFCAPFTGEIKDKNGEVPFSVMGQFTSPQTSPGDISNRYSKVLYGEWQWNSNHTDLIVVGGLNPNYNMITQGKLLYIIDCATALTTTTQQDMVSLFGKLGIIYVPQTKPFWEIDPTLLTDSTKSIGKWTNTLYK